MFAVADDRNAKPIDELKGVERAAAIMLSLSEEEGGRVLEFLEADEVRTLSAAMADMGTVSASAMGEVLSRFNDQVALYSSVSGSLDKTEAILTKALPVEQVAAIMSELRQPSRGVWKKLSSIDRSLLAGYLRGEHPQTTALVLSQIEAELSAKILSTFPQPLAIEVIDRMLKLQPVQKEILQQIEESLEADLLANFSVKKKMDTHAAMAEVFNLFDRSTEGRLMGALEEVNAVSSKRIRDLMFTFEDMAKLDKGAIQTIIQAADKTNLAKALQGANEMIANVFLSNMSSRAAKSVTDDIESMQGLARGEIETAQGELIRLAKGLMDRGEISKPRGKGDDSSSDFDA